MQVGHAKGFLATLEQPGEAHSLGAMVDDRADVRCVSGIVGLLWEFCAVAGPPPDRQKDGLIRNLAFWIYRIYLFIFT